MPALPPIAQHAPVLGPVQVVPSWTGPALRRNMAATGKQGQARSANPSAHTFRGTPRSARDGGECAVERSAVGGFMPRYAGAKCSGEPGDGLACGLAADAIGKPGAGDVGGSHGGGGTDGGKAFLDLGKGGAGA
jgi:hypothetical protein